MKWARYSLRRSLIIVATIAIAMACWKYQEPALAVAGAQLVALIALLRFMN